MESNLIFKPSQLLHSSLKLLGFIVSKSILRSRGKLREALAINLARDEAIPAFLAGNTTRGTPKGSPLILIE